MMPENDLKVFGAAIAQENYSEVGISVALIWYLTQIEGREEVTAAELAKLMHDLALRAQVNVTRLAERLGENTSVLRGSKKRAFKIRLAKLQTLTDLYEPMLARPKPKVEALVISKEGFSESRKYLHSMVDQINGCYQYGFYDGCAVMCRRLMETLLIQTFEHHNAGDKIKGNGEYLGLADIIAKAKSGQHFKLARGSASVMEAVKLLGDTAAHDKTYITKQQDIDDERFKFRKVISELLHLAELV